MLVISSFDVTQWNFQCHTEIICKRKTETITQIISFHYRIENCILTVLFGSERNLFFCVRCSGLVYSFNYMFIILETKQKKENLRLSSLIRYSWETSKQMARLTFKWAQSNMPMIPKTRIQSNTHKNQMEPLVPSFRFKFQWWRYTILLCSVACVRDEKKINEK